MRACQSLPVAEPYGKASLCIEQPMQELAKFIDHTVLKPDTTLADVRRICEEATKLKFAGVCIPPVYVRDARRFLGEDSRIRLATVVGFPMGYNAIAAKSEEIKRAIDEGADEIDAMINLAAVKTGNWNHVEHDIDSVARATHVRGKTLKLTLECGLLTPEELQQLCEMAINYRVNWLSSGTGFHGFAATPDMIRLLKTMVAANAKIKATGGIRTAAGAQALLDAGAERLGTSSALDFLGLTK